MHLFEKRGSQTQPLRVISVPRRCALLSTQMIERDDAFFELRDEWTDLLSRSGQDHLYLTHSYLVSWWKHLRGSASLRIVLVREHGELLAIAPIMLRRGTLLRCPVRRLEFIGSDWGYGGFILSKKKPQCLGRIFQVLKDTDSWDVMYLGKTLSDPEMDAQELAALLSQKDLVHESIRASVPYIPLQLSWEGYLAERSSSFRRNVRNRKKKLSELGKVRFLRVTNIEASGIPFSQVIGWIRTIAERSWKAREGTAISSSASMFAFYTELAERLNEMGSLDLSLLFVDERPVAYIFGARYKSDFFEVDIAYDLEFSKASPGTLIRNCLLQELFQRPWGKYDFVAYRDYKRELTSYVQDFDIHVIYSKKVYPLVLRWLRGRIRNRMGWLLKDYSDASWAVRGQENREG